MCDTPSVQFTVFISFISCFPPKQLMIDYTSWFVFLEMYYSWLKDLIFYTLLSKSHFSPTANKGLVLAHNICIPVLFCTRVNVYMFSFQVLSKKKLQDLVREIDPNEQLDEDVEEVCQCF